MAELHEIDVKELFLVVDKCAAPAKHRKIMFKEPGKSPNEAFNSAWTVFRRAMPGDIWTEGPEYGWEDSAARTKEQLEEAVIKHEIKYRELVNGIMISPSPLKKNT